MSDKAKVYQGVRVKTTVKELLQQRRALQAERVKTVKTKSQCLASQDVCISTLPAHYFDAFTGETDISFQQRSYPEHSCNMQMDQQPSDHQQPVMMIPNEGYNVGILPPPGPPPSSVQPWSHGHLHSPHVDYHTRGMAPASPSDSLNLASPVDYNSYSPQESSYSSSSSSSCYNSPTRMDSGGYNGSFVPEHLHYQHCNLQPCYCLSYWDVPDYTLHQGPTPTDCVYAPPVDSTYFTRDLSSDMCYL